MKLVQIFLVKETNKNVWTIVKERLSKEEMRLYWTLYKYNIICTFYKIVALLKNETTILC